MASLGPPVPSLVGIWVVPSGAGYLAGRHHEHPQASWTAFRSAVAGSRACPSRPDVDKTQTASWSPEGEVQAFRVVLGRCGRGWLPNPGCPQRNCDSAPPGRETAWGRFLAWWECVGWTERLPYLREVLSLLVGGSLSLLLLGGRQPVRGPLCDSCPPSAVLEMWGSLGPALGSPPLLPQPELAPDGAAPMLLGGRGQVMAVCSRHLSKAPPSPALPCAPGTKREKTPSDRRLAACVGVGSWEKISYLLLESKEGRGGLV